jgi:hypothetical protein
MIAYFHRYYGGFQYCFLNADIIAYYYVGWYYEELLL